MRIKTMYYFSFLVLLLFLLAGCFQQSARTAQEKVPPSSLNVQFSIEPEEGEVNEMLLFQAKVTYGDQIVSDADEVQFEIWRESDDYREKINVEHVANGIYQLEKSFAEEGTYYVYAHVTARDMHTMPKKEFTISR